jgi:AraC-like DNA-binding protein
MPAWQGFRYPAVTERDVVLELYLTSLGRIVHPAGLAYPAPGHPSEYQFSWKNGRRLGDFALVWIESGSGSVETASLGQVSLAPGLVLLLAPGEWHRYQPNAKTGWEERWVCANGTYLHRLRMNGVFPSNSEIRSLGDDKALDTAFDRLREQSDKNCLWTSSLMLAVIALALGETREGPRRAQGHSNSGDMLVDATIDYLWANCHRPLNVVSIAKHIGTSRRMLERRFAQMWRRSIAQELTLARVQRGKDLLLEESLTVKEAGYAAGFGGARRFISAYRRIFDATPGSARRYRKFSK